MFNVELAAIAGAVDRLIILVFTKAERPSDVVNDDLEAIGYILTEGSSNINQRLASA